MTTLESILNTFTHLFNLDLFIERDSKQFGLFDFATETSSKGDRECWGLGLHIVISPLQVSPQRVGRSIDYRHLVGALKRKPGAFARWVLRDAAFPRAVYRQTWERLISQRPEREACKTMVGLLVLAADGHEAQLAQELEQLIELGQLPDLNALTQLLAPPKGDVPQVASAIIAGPQAAHHARF